MENMDYLKYIILVGISIHYLGLGLYNDIVEATKNMREFRPMTTFQCLMFVIGLWFVLLNK